MFGTGNDGDSDNFENCFVTVDYADYDDGCDGGGVETGVGNVEWPLSQLRCCFLMVFVGSLEFYYLPLYWLSQINIHEKRGRKMRLKEIERN